MLIVEIARKNYSSVDLENKSHENTSIKLRALRFFLKKRIVMKSTVTVELRSTGQEAWISLKQSLQILQ